MFSAASVCLFVCQHVSFRTSKHRMMKLGGRCIVQKCRSSLNLRVIAHWVRTPSPNVALGYDIGKISTGCLVFVCVCLFVCQHFTIQACVTQVRTRDLHGMGIAEILRNAGKSRGDGN